MSLFSFFRRDKTAQGNNRAAGRYVSPANEKQGRRGRGAADEADPQLPEKQRARRRLVGSVVLVVATLIVLPLIFESKPQKPNLNVALQVDSKVSSPVSQPEPQPASVEQNTQPSANQNPSSPLEQQNAPQNGVVAPESASNNTVSAPVQKPVKISESDSQSEKIKADKADRERAEKERKTKAEREKADQERIKKERKARADRERTAKEKTVAKKQSVSSDPIGQMIANKTKRR
ncbi:MAG: hypothetical protein ACI4NO_07615 [Oxalobacter sp.]